MLFTKYICKYTFLHCCTYIQISYKAPLCTQRNGYKAPLCKECAFGLRHALHTKQTLCVAYKAPLCKKAHPYANPSGLHRFARVCTGGADAPSVRTKLRFVAEQSNENRRAYKAPLCKSFALHLRHLRGFTKRSFTGTKQSFVRDLYVGALLNKIYYKFSFELRIKLCFVSRCVASSAHHRR